MSQSAADGESGFEDFVATRGDRLYRAAWLLTGDAHAAEDLLQTVLARVWPKWSRIAGDNPEAYTRRALVNGYATWWRRRWRGETPTGDLPEVSPARNVFADIDLEQSLASVIRQLPPRQRVVVLRYFEDLSVEETAPVLGCRPGTVKSQAAKALRLLRRQLTPSHLLAVGEQPCRVRKKRRHRGRKKNRCV
ncbi:SigE family RNA polymerase sigma factor [Streptomyces sp. NPDC096013]|uniref:SigE family RNA polymerase sigma factor n=1 Tax=Streptomyces sp. NPDC096013 TaxID=3366069 RepID=UPI00382B5D9B